MIESIDSREDFKTYMQQYSLNWQMSGQQRGPKREGFEDENFVSGRDLLLFMRRVTMSFIDSLLSVSHRVSRTRAAARPGRVRRQPLESILASRCSATGSKSRASSKSAPRRSSCTDSRAKGSTG